MSHLIRNTVVGVLSALSFAAHAETTLCTEVVPPVTITAPGIYCLFHDYALSLATGAAITVNASNVVIDFNGHRIGNMGGGSANSAYGVRSYNSSTFQGYQNLTIRNGVIRGFGFGVVADGVGSQGHLVEDMLLDRNLTIGVGLFAAGSVVRGNRVVATGTISTRNSWTVGIVVSGDTSVVANNEVLDTVGAQEVMGIQVAGPGIVVSGNRVTKLAAGSGYSEYGVWASGVGHVSNNSVIDTALPDGGSTTGIHAVTSGIKVLNNVVSVSGPGAYSGGTQVAGTNN